MVRKTSLLLSLTFLCGCSVEPNYLKPFMELPKQWLESTKALPLSLKPAEKKYETPAIKPHDALAFWSSFKDPVLTALIKEAVAANDDLMIAAARVAEARASLRAIQANQLPDLDIRGAASRTKVSALTNQGFTPPTYNDFSLATVLDYEIDIWGRFARSSEAARAQLLAVRSNQDAVRLAVTTDVALAYFNLRALDEQVAIAEHTVTTRKEALSVLQAQFRADAISSLTLHQAESELATAQLAVPQLRQSRIAQESALAVLLGRSPKALLETKVERGTHINSLPVPPVVPDDLPSTLLERRPDIRAAEQSLIAANARIGVQKTAYFPRLSLSSLIGLNSRETDNLFSKAAENWNIAGNTTLPFLSFFTTRANVKVAKAKKEQALATYQKAVRTAFKEVSDALSAQKNTIDRLDAETARINALKESLRLAQVRYDAGYSNYLEVLDSRRGLFQAELDAITAQRERLAATVNLVKALGGSWLSP